MRKCRPLQRHFRDVTLKVRPQRKRAATAPVMYSHIHLNVPIFLFIFLTVTKAFLEPFSSPTYTSACGSVVNPLTPEPNPICYLLALLGAHHFLHVSRIRVKLLTFKRLMSYIYIYGAPILDVSRSHTTQHSR